LATPAAAIAIPVKPRTAAIKATMKKIRAQRNMIESSESLRSGTNAGGIVNSYKRSENSTAGIVGHATRQNHTAEHLFFNEVIYVVGKSKKTQRIRRGYQPDTKLS
jgi:predicted protein tyrosine phosphatase